MAQRRPATDPSRAAFLNQLADAVDGASAETVLAGAVPWIAAAAGSQHAGLFLVRARSITAEAWHPAPPEEPEARDAWRAAAIEPAPTGIAVGPSRGSTLLVASQAVSEELRLVACARRGRGRRSTRGSDLLGGAMRVLAAAIARFEVARQSAAERERQESWFRILDRQIRVLDRERQKFSAIVGQPDLYVYVTDANRVVTWTNKAFAEAFAVPPGRNHWLGAECHEVCERLGIGRRGSPCVTCPLARALRTNKPSHHDLRSSLGGAARSLYLTALPIRGPEGVPGEVMVLIQNLSDLRALRRSEARYRQFFERNSTAMLMVEPATHRIVLANPASTAVFGCSQEKLLGLSLRDLHPPGEWMRIEARYVVAATDPRPEAFECVLRGRDGSECIAVVQASCFEIEARELLMIQFLDVTALRRAEETLERREEQLRQVQRLETVGRLAGGMAHEFNNLLSVILGRSELLREEVPSDSPARHHAEEIREASERGAWLTRQLLAFGRRELAIPRVMNLSLMVTEMEGMLRSAVGPTVEFVLRCDSEPAWVRADRSQLEQVLVNLVANARQAMPAGGTLTIEIAHRMAPEARADEAPLGWVVLTVRDTGTGIDDVTRAHLFDPFLDPPRSDSGAPGLGLSVVQGIVARSGGRIDVETAPGEGSAFHIHLPRVDEVFVDDSPPTLPEARGREAILLVDDDRAVRAVASEVLVLEGYEVIEASGGPEALEIARRRGAPFDLLVTDVVMPQMSGGELAQRLLPLHPDLKVLFISGYADDAIVRNGVIEAGAPFVAKPFTLETFTAKVREVLDTSASIDL
jgi:PAS domain S-box-containing protein